MMKKILLMALMTLSFNANAVYVHVAGDNHFTDDATGQEWLRLDQTFNVSVADALVLNSDYRGATKTEIQNLLDFFFPNATYVNGVATGGNPSDLWSQVIPYFATVGSRGVQDAYENAKGIYFADNRYHLAGAERANESYYNDDYAEVNGTTNPPLTFINTSRAYSDMGVWLVKDVSPVPIPATIWLLGSGLLGLVAVGRRRHK